MKNTYPTRYVLLVVLVAFLSMASVVASVNIVEAQKDSSSEQYVGHAFRSPESIARARQTSVYFDGYRQYLTKVEALKSQAEIGDTLYVQDLVQGRILKLVDASGDGRIDSVATVEENRSFIFQLVARKDILTYLEAPSKYVVLNIRNKTKATFFVPASEAFFIGNDGNPVLGGFRAELVDLRIPQSGKEVRVKRADKLQQFGQSAARFTQNDNAVAALDLAAGTINVVLKDKQGNLDFSKQFRTQTVNTSRATAIAAYGDDLLVLVAQDDFTGTSASLVLLRDGMRGNPTEEKILVNGFSQFLSPDALLSVGKSKVIYFGHKSYGRADGDSIFAITLDDRRVVQTFVESLGPNFYSGVFTALTLAE